MARSVSKARQQGTRTTKAQESEPRPAGYRESFLLLIAALLLASVGQWLNQTVDTIEVRQFARGPNDLNTFLAATAIPLAIVPLVGGVLADRFSRVVVLRWSVAVQVIAVAVFALLAFLRALTTAEIIALAVAVVAALSIASPTRHAFLADLIAPGNLLRAIALSSVVVNLGDVLGPLTQIGVDQLTAIKNIADLAPYLLAAAAVYLFAAVILLQLMRGPSVKRASSEASLPTALGESLDYLDERGDLLLLLGLVALIAVFGQAFSQLSASYAHDALRVGGADLANLRVPVTAGSLLIAVVLACFGAPRQLRRPLLVAAQVGLVVSVFGTYLSSSLLFIRLFLGLSGLCAGAFGILAATILLTETRPELRGRMMGPYAILLGGLAPLGSLVATRLTFWFGGNALLVVAVVIFASLIYAVTRPAWRMLGDARDTTRSDRPGA